MKVLGISGTIVGVKTSILVQHLLEIIKLQSLNIECEMLDLRDFDIQFCDGRQVELYNKDTREVIEKIKNADVFIIGTPVFNNSFPAPLKNIIDLIPPEVFRHKVMGFVANGGTYQHYLMVENQLKPIAGYLRAHVAPSYVYAHTTHFNENNEIIDQEVLERIQSLAQELMYMQIQLNNATVLPL